jgi:hypothetical protein
VFISSVLDDFLGCFFSHFSIAHGAPTVKEGERGELAVFVRIHQKNNIVLFFYNICFCA